MKNNEKLNTLIVIFIFLVSAVAMIYVALFRDADEAAYREVNRFNDFRVFNSPVPVPAE